jgi:tricorn protease
VFATQTCFASAQEVSGYYRLPVIHCDTVVFTAEGDLWRASLNGGVAQRLTKHPGRVYRATISPDRRTIAFSDLQIRDLRIGV